VCERVTGGADPLCAPPGVVRGKVFALAGRAALAGARVVAVDMNRGPVSAVAVSGAGGAQELRIPTERDAAARRWTPAVTLRPDAAGHQPGRPSSSASRCVLYS
jgi:hypothetical protein